MKKFFSIKFTAILLSFSLLINQVLPAEAQALFSPSVSLGKTSHATKWFDTLEIPENFVKEVRRYSGKQDKTILLLQDAHVYQSAQKSIAGALTYFSDRYQLKQIYLEGAQGDLDTQMYSFFPDKKALGYVSNYYLEEGRLTGAEFASIVLRSNLNLYGVEDKELYQKNRDAYLDVLQTKEDYDELILVLENILKDLGKFILSEDLRQLSLQQYEWQDKDFQFYADYLIGVAEKNAINLGSYPALSSYFKLHGRDQQQVYRSAESEFKNLLLLNAADLPLKIKEMWLDNTDERNLYDLKVKSFHKYLQEKKPELYRDLSAHYPNLSQVLKFLEVFQNSSESFLVEIEKLSSELQKKLIQNEEEAYFLEMYRVLEIYKKMFKLHLTKEDVRYFQLNRERFNVKSMMEFLKPRLERYKFSTRLDYDFESLEVGLSKVERFYTIALNRDQVLASNAIKHIEMSHENLAAFVVGGFHVPGIESYLKEEGYSYIVLTPEMKQMQFSQDSEALYQEAMLQKPTEVETTLQSFTTLLRGDEMSDSFFQLVPELFVVTKNQRGDLPESTRNFYRLAILKSLFNSDKMLNDFVEGLRTIAPKDRIHVLENALSGLSPSVIEVKKNGNRFLWKPSVDQRNGQTSFDLLGQVDEVTPQLWASLGSFQARNRDLISLGGDRREANMIHVKNIDSSFVPTQVLSLLKLTALARKSEGDDDSHFFLLQEKQNTPFTSDDPLVVSPVAQSEIAIRPLDAFFDQAEKTSLTKISEEAVVESKSLNEEIPAETAQELPHEGVQETKSAFRFNVNILPEVLTVAVVTWMSGAFVALPIYFVITRAFWIGVFLSHGVGHVFMKALLDREQKVDWSEVSEGFRVKELLYGLIPFSPLYTPWVSSVPKLISVGDQQPVKVALKAIAGPLSNLFGATLSLYMMNEFFNHPYLNFAFSIGFILNSAFALMSLSDYKSFLQGTAECGYGCGILWVTAKREEGENTHIYPERIESVLSNVLHYMSLFGSHGVGAAAQFINEKTGEMDFAHFKMPSGYGQNPFFFKRIGRTALIEQFLAFFKTETSAAISRKASAGKFWNVSGHVRLKTSGGKLEVETTQPFYINPDEPITYWVNDGRKMVQKKIRNIAYSAANGDNQKARLPGSLDGPYFSESDWGKFFERAYGLPVGANDSEKAAYMIYFLRTKGSFEDSLRLAYVATFFKSLDDKIPSRQQFKKWAKRLEPLVEVYGLEDWSDPETLEKLQQEAIQILPRDASLPSAPEKEYQKFIEYAMLAFQQNDTYKAAKIMMSMVNEYSTYGFFFESTLEPGKRVLISREQPVAIAENQTRKIQLGGSSLKFLKTAIWQDPNYQRGDRLRTLKLDMTKAHSDRGGEIAEFDYNASSLKIYSMNLDRELSAEEISHRWKDATHDEPDWVAPSLDDDPMVNDLMNSLAVTQAIHEDWLASDNLTSENLKSAKVFSQRWIENAKSFDSINQVVQQSGLNVPVQHGAPDLFIVVFREENITIGEWFKKLMQETYGLANIQIVNGNEYIRSIDSHPLYLNTNTLFIDLGFNFPIIRAAEEHERRAQRKEEVAPENVQAQDGQDLQTEASWKVLEFLRDRKPPHTFIITPTQGNNISESFDLGNAHVITSKYFPDVDGGTAVSWSQIVSLLELYLQLLKDMRTEFPKGAPLGLTLSKRDIQGLQKAYEHMITRDLPDILGIVFNSNGRVIKVNTPAYQNLKKLSEELLPYFTEQARATALSTVHLLVAVAFTGTLIQLVATIILSGFGPLWGLPSIAFSFLSHLLDVPLFLFFKWLSVIYFRISENREVLHRDQNPSIVLGDDQWSRLIRVSLSKMFALAKGIISPTAIYDSKQLSELEGKHGHDTRRGTMIFLSGPTNNTPSDYVSAAFQGVGLIQSQAESFASINAVGPLMVGIMDVPEKDAEAFKLGHHASIYSESRSQIQSSDRFDDPEHSGKLLELAFSGPLRMLSHQFVFVHLVRMLQDVKLGYPLQWHRGDNQNSIGATTQAPIRPPKPEWKSGQKQVQTILSWLLRKSTDVAASRDEEKHDERSEATVVKIQRKIPGGGMLFTDEYRPDKRSELRSSEGEDKLSFEKLEPRLPLNANSDEMFPSVPKMPDFNTTTYFVGDLVADLTQRIETENGIATAGVQEIIYDGVSGTTVETVVRYTQENRAIELRLTPITYDPQGRTKSFVVFQIENGKITQSFEAEVKEYDETGQFVKVEATAINSNEFFTFLFTTALNPFTQSTTQVASSLKIKSGENLIVVTFDPEKIKFSEADGGEEETPKKAARESVLPSEPEDFSREMPSLASSSQGISSSERIAVSDPLIEVNPFEGGLSPDDALKLLPTEPDYSVPPVDVAAGEEILQDVTLQEPEALEFEEELVASDDTSSTMTAATPPIRLIRSNGQSLVLEPESSEETALSGPWVDFFSKTWMGITALIGIFVYKLGTFFSAERFALLMVSAVIFYSLLPSSIWIFSPLLLGIFSATLFVGQESVNPKISFDRRFQKLSIYFPRAANVEIKLANGKKTRVINFERVGNHYESSNGGLKAWYDSSTEKIMISVQENIDISFQHLSEEGEVESFLSLELPFKQANPWKTITEQVSLSKTKEKAPHIIKWSLLASVATGTLFLVLKAKEYRPYVAGLNFSFEYETVQIRNGFSLEPLYWGSIFSLAVVSLIIIKKLFVKKVPRSASAFLSQLLFLSSFFLIGKVLLNFSSMQTVLAGIALFYFFVVAGYFFLDVLKWTATLLTLPFRWIPNIARLTTPRQNFVSFIGMSLISTASFLIYQQYKTFDSSQKNSMLSSERTFLENFDLELKSAPSLQKRTDEETSESLVEVTPLEALSFTVSDKSPIIYGSEGESSSVKLISSANGYLALDSLNPQIAPAEWIIPKTTFEVVGGAPLFELQRPDVDARAQSVEQFGIYLESIHSDFENSGIYRILPRSKRLFDMGEPLARRIENYEDQQAVQVYGEIRVPLRHQENGLIIPSPRSLGTTTDESVLALVHSKKRLTVQLAVPIAVWKNHDLAGMNVFVKINNSEVPAKIIRMDIQPRLNGQLILTLGLMSKEEIFDWDEEKEAPKPVDLRVEIPLKFKPVSYSEKLPPQIMIRSYGQFDERVAVPLNPTAMTGRVDFVKDEASWVFANEVVAGIDAGDREELEAIAKDINDYAEEVRLYLIDLQALREKGAVEKYPVEVRKFSEYFIQMQELLSKKSFFDFRSPQMGLLTETFESQGQAFTDKPVAQIITPEISIHHRIQKTVTVTAGDIVIIRRPSTGEETLGIVRQINDELPSPGSGDDQSDFKEAFIQVYNTPDLWFADHEYGIEVIYVTDDRGQSWLKKYYDDQQLRFKSVYSLERKDQLPHLFPMQFVNPAENENRQILIQMLEESSSLTNPTTVREAVFQRVDLPLELQQEQSETYAMPKVAFSSAKINRIVREANGGLRREWMNLFLQNPNIPIEEIEYIALEGSSDISQMSIDYLLDQRRIIDLIHLHRKLYQKHPELDMTKLARSHVLELIETSEDALKRLVQLDHFDERRGEVQEFFISVLTKEGAAFDEDDSIVVRKILTSNFWRTYAEKLLLAKSIEDVEESNELYFRRKAVALLISNQVFLEISQSIGWTLGEPQEQAKDLNSVKRLDREIWYRLRNIVENDKQDRTWLHHSPWSLSYQDPREYFKGRINQKLYDMALVEYEAQLSEVQQITPTPKISVLDFDMQTGPLLSEHVFRRLDEQSQKNYVENLKGHALERFLEISERAENSEYTKRREQILNQLVSNHHEENNILLARVFLKSSDAKVLELLIAKEVDRLMIEALSEKIHENADHQELLLFQQAVVKLSGMKGVSAGVRVLAIRTVLESLSDFEIKDLLEKNHPLLKLFHDASVSEEAVISLTQEELLRRSSYWAIDLATEWSTLTLDSQLYAASHSALEDVRKALEIEGFYPERFEIALKSGYELHPQVFERFNEFSQFRRDQILKGSERDELSHIETSRLSIGAKISLVSMIFGILIRIFSFITLKHDRNAGKNKKGFLSKLFIWSFISVGFFAVNTPETQAQTVLNVSTKFESQSAKQEESFFKALDAKQELTKTVEEGKLIDFSDEAMQGINFNLMALQTHEFVKSNTENIESMEQGEIVLNFRSDLHTKTFVLQLAEVMRTHKNIHKLSILKDIKTTSSDWELVKKQLSDLDDYSRLRIDFFDDASSLRVFVKDRQVLRNVSNHAVIQIAEPSRLRQADRGAYARVLLGAAPLGQETILVLGGEDQIFEKIHFFEVADLVQSMIVARRRIDQSA